VREKVEQHVDGRQVVYDGKRWDILFRLRSHAAEVQRTLPFRTMVYGSVARGDVHEGSDVDIIVLEAIPSYQIELALSREYDVLERRLTMATPNATPKAHISTEGGTTISWPLLSQSDRESAFYAFGGWLDAASAAPRERVPGVSKRLLLIRPTPEGHMESSVIGAEVEVARHLAVSVDIVQERVRVLTRRDKVGRTGVFRSEPLDEGQTFEQLLESMAARSPAIRRQLRHRSPP
jgi:predicted nucleotidyltransferase